jgi:hypothetical protein
VGEVVRHCNRSNAWESLVRNGGRHRRPLKSRIDVIQVKPDARMVNLLVETCPVNLSQRRHNVILVTQLVTLLVTHHNFKMGVMKGRGLAIPT